MHVVVIGIILLLLMVFVITPAVNRVFAPPDVPPASSTEVTPPSGSQQGTEGENPQTSEPDPTLSNIQVIQVKDIMIPGDTITEDNVQAAEISAAGKSIYAYDKGSKVAQAYADFSKEVLADADRQRKLSSERIR